MKSLAVDGSGAAVWQWNAGKDQITVAQEIERSAGRAPGTLDTTVDRFLQHMHAADRERFRLMLWSLQENQGGELQTEFRLKRQDGSYLWYELRARAAPSDNTRLLRCVGLMRDITSLKRSHERLMHDAVHDSLTSLPNRELFLDRLQGAITRAREGQMNRPTVMFIDVDRFKNVNKSFGLAVGDSMLLTLGRRLSRHLNPQDTLARLGSDQFAILMISETDPRQVATLAERVRRALRTPMKIGGKEIVLTASIGIVVDDGVQPTAQDLLREGEIAMLRAKRAGADRIEIFTASMRGEDESRLPLESDLRKALEKRQIAVLYQPITRLASNQLAGFEALIRWDHPTRGQLSPDEFVPIAEETGLIGELGSYVLGQALEEARPLAQGAAARARPALRQRQCVEPPALPPGSGAGDQVDPRQARRCPRGRSSSKSPSRWSWKTPSAPWKSSSWLKAFGASLALDDFGTGYCSLSYLHRFPCDTIKVDRSLVRDSGLNGSTPMILRSIVALSHELGKEVIAEGVETAEDAAYLALDRLRIRPGLLLRGADDAEGGGRPVVGAREPPQAAAAREVEGGSEEAMSRRRQWRRPVAQAAPPRPKPAASGVS